MVELEHVWQSPTDVLSPGVHLHWAERYRGDRTQPLLRPGRKAYVWWSFNAAPEGQEEPPLLGLYEVAWQETLVLREHSSIAYEDSATPPGSYIVLGFTGTRWLDMVPSISAELPAQRPSPQVLLTRLREWMGLTMTQLAETLGVSRRTLYSWIEAGRFSRENENRLLDLAAAIQPLAERWKPNVVRNWLFSGSPNRGELIRGGRLQELATEIEESLASTEIPVLQAHLIDGDVADEGTEISLSGNERVLAFRELTMPRGARVEVHWQPPELSDTPHSDDR
jgi:DNA-binding XRE family transcriptional regulator